MRFHPKDQVSKQKKLPFALKSMLGSKILTSAQAEFPVDSLVRTVSDLGFQQIIPSPFADSQLYSQNAELSRHFGPKIWEVEAPEKKFAFPPTHILSVFKRYLSSLGEEDAPVVRWFYVFPTVVLNDQRLTVQHELGIFIMGDDSIVANAHLIDAVSEMLKNLTIPDFVLEVNSLGCKDCQKEYQSLLTEHFSRSNFSLCEQCQEKLENGRFTMWSCEKARCQELLAGAPQIVDFLDDDCRTNLIGVLEAVDSLGISYNLNPLLSGHISHERIYFRISSDSKGFLGEGANYAPWSKYLGSPDFIPMIGFVTTLERLLPHVPPDRQKSKPKVAVFLVSLGDMACRKTLGLRKLLHDSGIKTWESILGRPGIKNQLKEAHDHGSEITLIVGQKEALDETVILRDMRSGMQEIFSFDRIIEEVKKRLG